jgi:hypothetical protein
MDDLDEEKIFGPLSLRQFLYVSLGFGLAYLGYRFLDSMLGIPFIVIGIGLALKAFINVPTIIINEEYIKAKRYHCKNLEEFQKWLKRKIVMCQSQIEIRRQRGMTIDPELEKTLKMFQTALIEIK